MGCSLLPFLPKAVSDAINPVSPVCVALQQFFALLRVEGLHKLADVLRAVAAGHQQRIRRVDHDQVFHADQRHRLLRVHIVPGCVFHNQIALRCVAVPIFLGDLIDRFPTTDIVPADVVERDARNRLGLFDDGVIDGNVLAKRIGWLPASRAKCLLSNSGSPASSVAVFG